MPKKQPTPAKVARAVQRNTGQKYTAALREAECKNPFRALARELRAAGFSATEHAPALDDHLDAEHEESQRLEPLEKAIQEAEAALHEAPAGTSRAELGALERALRAAEAAHPGYDYDHDNPFESQQIRAYWIFHALRHVGAGHGGPRFAHVTAAALDFLTADSLLAADWVRHRWLAEATQLKLSGPNTQAAAAARKAAAALAHAFRIPFRGDEEWFACARALDQAAGNDHRWATGQYVPTVSRPDGCPATAPGCCSRPSTPMPSSTTPRSRGATAP